MREGKKPNILLILTDDQGAWAMNCAGNCEAAYSEIVGRMRGELRDWFARYVDPARDGALEPVAGHGQLGLCGIAASGREAFVAR